MMRPTKLVWYAAGAVLLMAVSAANAQTIKMDITGPGSRVSAVAVPPLKDLGGDDNHEASNEFTSTLRKNLQLSGYFKIIDPHSYVEDSQQSGYQLGQFNFADWTSINAEFLVKGGVTVKGNEISVEVYLFDVANQRQATGKRFSGERGEVPRMARRFADAILQVLTGQRGPFDSRVAFVSTRAGRFKEVYVMAVDGSGVYKVTNNPTINLFPRFDHTAANIIYLSYKNSTPALYIANLASQRETRVSSNLGQVVGGTLTPDGNSVVAAIEKNGATNLFLLDKSGSMIRPLTEGGAINVSPSVSADGSRLAFASDRSGNPQIYVMPMAGGGARRVTYQGNYNAAPTLSPKGDKVAYQSRHNGVFDIYVVATSGGQGTQLTNGAGSNQEPAWSPDGRYIVFSSNREGAWKLFLMQADTGKVVSAISEESGDDTSPAWSWWIGE